MPTSNLAQTHAPYSGYPQKRRELSDPDGVIVSANEAATRPSFTSVEQRPASFGPDHLHTR
jgi:hypothetical protein